MCGAAAGETAADLFGQVKLSTPKGSGSGDRVAWAAIAWSLGLKEAEYSFGAISRPCRHDPSIGFAQRLRRTHSRILPTSAHAHPLRIGREQEAFINDVPEMRGTGSGWVHHIPSLVAVTSCSPAYDRVVERRRARPALARGRRAVCGADRRAPRPIAGDRQGVLLRPDFR